MQARQSSIDTNRYARGINVAKRICWDIDNDVNSGRTLDVSRRFLPAGLSLVADLDFLRPEEQRFLSQIQSRSCTNIFRLIQRFIRALVLKAYQWQYIVSSVKEGQFVDILGWLVSPAQLDRVGAAPGPSMYAAPQSSRASR